MGPRLPLSALLALCLSRAAEIVKSRFVVAFADSPGLSNRIAPSYITTSVSRVTETGEAKARDLSGGRPLAERVKGDRLGEGEEASVN